MAQFALDVLLYSGIMSFEGVAAEADTTPNGIQTKQNAINVVTSLLNMFFSPFLQYFASYNYNNHIQGKGDNILITLLKICHYHLNNDILYVSQVIKDNQRYISVTRRL